MDLSISEKSWKVEKAYCRKLDPVIYVFLDLVTIERVGSTFMGGTISFANKGLIHWGWNWIVNDSNFNVSESPVAFILPFI